MKFKDFETVIPKASLKDLGLENIDVELTETVPVDGNITEFELEVITKLVKLHQPKKIFEIGTFDGRTAANLAQATFPGSLLYTLDLPQKDMNNTKLPLYDNGYSSDRKYINKETIGDRFKGKNGAEKIIQLYGDSATFDFSPYSGEIDFIFIDGSHAAGYVANDTETAFKLAQKNSNTVVVWHDYDVWKDVTDVLNSYYKNDSRFKEAKWIDGTCFVVLSYNPKNI